MNNDREKYRNMSIKKRIELIEKLFIMHPSFKRCFDTIRNCQEYSKISREPLCALITGEPGVGKTTLCEKYEAKCPRIELNEKTIIPVLIADIPIPATTKNMVTALLVAMGDPLADKGTTFGKTLSLFKLIKECEVEIIIIDEFHHIVDKDSHKVLHTVSDWLKQLIIKTKVPILLVGLPHSVKILEANSQLERRFSMREGLIDFKWIETTEKYKSEEKNNDRSTDDDFRAFLKVIDDSLPMAEASHLEKRSIAFRIWEATKGNVNRTMKIVRYAATHALKNGEEKIALFDLEKAYEILFSMDSSNNPFGI